MRLRIVDCGLRIDDGRSWRIRTRTFPIRNPQSAIRVLLFVAACTPVTTRPDFLPDPQGIQVILDARTGRVTPVIATLVAAGSRLGDKVAGRDGYVERHCHESRLVL